MEEAMLAEPNLLEQISSSARNPITFALRRQCRSAALDAQRNEENLRTPSLRRRWATGLSASSATPRAPTPACGSSRSTPTGSAGWPRGISGRATALLSGQTASAPVACAAPPASGRRVHIP